MKKNLEVRLKETEELLGFKFKPGEIKTVGYGNVVIARRVDTTKRKAVLTTVKIDSRTNKRTIRVESLE